MKTIANCDTRRIAGGDNPGMGPYDAPISVPVSPPFCIGSGASIGGYELKLCFQLKFEY
jgi:hypothetical protein